MNIDQMTVMIFATLAGMMSVLVRYVVDQRVELLESERFAANAMLRDVTYTPVSHGAIEYLPSFDAEMRKVLIDIPVAKAPERIGVVNNIRRVTFEEPSLPEPLPCPYCGGWTGIHQGHCIDCAGPRRP